MNDCLLRPLQADELDLLSGLERQCFTPPWSEKQLNTYLSNSRSCGYLLHKGEQVVGFALFSTLLDEAELLQIGIIPECRGLGLGELLLSQCQQDLWQRAIARILLEVRISNKSAIGLYHKLGYQQDGLRKGYYPAAAGREDAVLMSYSKAMLDSPA